VCVGGVVCVCVYVWGYLAKWACGNGGAMASQFAAVVATANTYQCVHRTTGGMDQGMRWAAPH